MSEDTTLNDILRRVLLKFGESPNVRGTYKLCLQHLFCEGFIVGGAESYSETKTCSWRADIVCMHCWQPSSLCWLHEWYGITGIRNWRF